MDRKVDTNDEKAGLTRVIFEDEKIPKVRAYYKYELAAMYNVCTKTFSAWIYRYFEELQQFGYTKNTKLLRPEIVRFLFERLGDP